MQKRTYSRKAVVGIIALIIAGLVALPAAAHSFWANSAETGALVASVDPDGPAADAGVQRGDVIVDVTGSEIANRADLFETIADVDIGDRLRVVVSRGGSERTVNLVVGEASGSPYLGVLLGPDAGGEATFGNRGPGSQRRGMAPHGFGGRSRGRGGPQQGPQSQPHSQSLFRGPFDGGSL